MGKVRKAWTRSKCKGKRASKLDCCESIAVEKRLHVIARIEEEYCCRITEVLLGFAAIGYSLKDAATTLSIPSDSLQYMMKERGVTIDWPSTKEGRATEESYFSFSVSNKRSEKSVAQLARILAYEKEKEKEHG